MLNDFLGAKTQKAVCWPLAEKRRDHLVYKLGEACALVSHQVERKGSPYKLILTKKPEIHEGGREIFKSVRGSGATGGNGVFSGRMRYYFYH